MCYIKQLYTKSQSVTGYKIVIERDNGFFSPFTGMKYKVGRVPDLKKDDYLNAEPGGQLYFYNKMHPIFQIGMIGKTGVIMNMLHAETFLKKSLNRAIHNGWSIQYTILKMTISGELYIGSFGEYDVIIGNTIDKFEKINS